MADAMNAGNNPPRQGGSTDRAQSMRPRRVGLSRRGERWLNIGGIAVIAAFALAWSWSIAVANETGITAATGPARAVAAALTNPSSPTAAYVTDAALDALVSRSRGASGKLNAKLVLPEEVDRALGAAANFAQITLTPFSAKDRGRIGLYYIGSWPAEHGVRGPSKAPRDRYANPRGFIQVTQANQDTKVSEHFRLKNFLTHDQQNVWPKYLVLEMRTVDKLELVLEDLGAQGIDVSGVTVMSGFRTPQYNAGGGNTGGRADLSRHMYGDAADIFIDSDHNGSMDDLNRDGRVDARDASVILKSVEKVERDHPELIGGAGVYVACCGHGPFIHIDTRGYRARWTGSGGG